VEFLVGAANAVVATRVQGTPKDVDALAAQLNEVAEEARRQGIAPVADYFAVLRAMLLGQDTTTSAAALEEPFRGLMGQVTEALAGADAEGDTEPDVEAEPGQAEPMDEEMDEEQAFLAGLVAAANAVVVARAQGDPSTVARLDSRLTEMEATLRGGEEAVSADYVAALRAALAGESAAPLAARLPEPFRSILKEVTETLGEVEEAQAEAAGPPAGGDAEAEGLFGEVN
jgi:hypothetical protein